MFKKQKEYFFSYQYTKASTWGFGDVSVTRDKPPKTYEDIQEIRDQLKKERGFTDLVIISWLKF